MSKESLHTAAAREYRGGFKGTTQQLLNALRHPTGSQTDRLVRSAAADEIEDLRTSVIAFGSPWAAQFARDAGYPRGHLHPTHYDILARAGARMEDFVRHEDQSDARA